MKLKNEYLGSVCSVKTLQNETLATGHVGKIGDEHVDLIDNTGDLPLLAYSTVVKLDIPNERLGFRSLMGTVYISTKKLLRIANPMTVSEFEKRIYFRVRIDEPVFIFLPSEEAPNQPQNGEMLEVRLADLSLGGMQFVTNRSFTLGDTIYILLKIMDRELMLCCTIGRYVEQRDSKRGYGCEFVGISERQRDVIYKYLLKKEGEQRAKKRL